MDSRCFYFNNFNPKKWTNLKVNACILYLFFMIMGNNLTVGLMKELKGVVNTLKEAQTILAFWSSIFFARKKIKNSKRFGTLTSRLFLQNDTKNTNIIAPLWFDKLYFQINMKSILCASI